MNLRPLNVILIVVSSLSELHFQRTMPQTLKYLEYLQEKTQKTPTMSNTHVFHYEKYHAVASSVLKNQISLFTGISSHKRDFSKPEIYKLWLDENADKKAEWLWDLYRNSGYVTMFSEEHCILSQSIRNLFTSKTPKIDNYFTDLYCQFANDPLQGQIPSNSRLQTKVNESFDHSESSWFQDNLLKQKDGWRKGSSCIGNKFIHSILFEYIDQFINSYNNDIPFFAPFVLMEAVEPTRTRIKTLDHSLYSFLNHLEETNILKDTLVVLTSEQGLLDIPKDLANTIIRNPKESTNLELQYPFLYLLVPPIISQYYPQTFDSLKSNQLSIITNLDLYTSLRRFPKYLVPNDHIFDNSYSHPNRTFVNSYDYKDQDKFIPYDTISIFDEIADIHRNCRDALVPGEMCRCNHTLIDSNMILPLTLFLIFSIGILFWWFWSWCA